MSDKNSMIFYYDWLNLFDELTNAEIGELVLAAVRYDQDGEDTPFKDRGLRVAFKALKNSIDISNEKYTEICEKRKKAAERRWNANASNCMQMHPNANFASYTDTDTDTDTVTDTGTVTVTETDTDTESGSGGTQPTPPHEGKLPPESIKRIISQWNSQTCTRNIQSITGDRLNRTIVMVGGNPDRFIKTINSLDTQQYLVTQARTGKKTEYDWFVQPNNYQKVVEGNYREDYSAEGGRYGQVIDWAAVGSNLG